VVADEVRQLAARTSGSTSEISTMIGLIQSETRQAIKSMDGTRDRAAEGVELANQAGTVILQIRDGASGLSFNIDSANPRLRRTIVSPSPESLPSAL